MLDNTTIFLTRTLVQDVTMSDLPGARTSFGGEPRGSFQSPVPMDVDTPPSSPHIRQAANTPSYDFAALGTIERPTCFSFGDSSRRSTRGGTGLFSASFSIMHRSTFMVTDE